jgi:molecular chaperone GrpE
MLVAQTRSLLRIQKPFSNVKGFHGVSSVLLNKESTDTQAEADKAQQQDQAGKVENKESNELKALQEKLNKSQTEMADFKDRYLRAMAETENVRVRMLKQVEDAKSFGIQKFCKDLLEVADVLNMAINNTDPSKLSDDELLKNPKEHLNSMYKGLVMTEGSLLKIFEKHGLVRIKPNEGEKFDPNQHEAIFRVPLPDKESGTINVVTKIGFKLNERVIRAAQVGVIQ